MNLISENASESVNETVSSRTPSSSVIIDSIEYILYDSSSVIPVVTDTIDLSDTTKYYYIEVREDIIRSYVKAVYQIRVFNQVEDYEVYYELTYGEDISVYRSFTDELRAYALETEVDSFYVLNDSFPQHYIDFRDSLMEVKLGSFDDPSEISSRNHSAEFKDPSRCSGDPTMFTLPRIGFPNLWLLGWRNRVSSFRGVGIYGIHIPIRRAWYRSPFMTIRIWGFSCIDFSGPLSNANNNTNSWFNWEVI